MVMVPKVQKKCQLYFSNARLGSLTDVNFEAMKTINNSRLFYK
jgi:hypothetical protein